MCGDLVVVVADVELVVELAVGVVEKQKLAAGKTKQKLEN